MVFPICSMYDLHRSATSEGIPFCVIDISLRIKLILLWPNCYKSLLLIQSHVQSKSDAHKADIFLYRIIVRVCQLRLHVLGYISRTAARFKIVVPILHFFMGLAGMREAAPVW